MQKELQAVKKVLGWGTSYSDSYRAKNGKTVVFASDLEIIREQMQDLNKKFSRGLADLDSKIHNDVTVGIDRIMTEVDMKIDKSRQ